MQQNSGSELVSILYKDTKNRSITWVEDKYEASKLYPLLDIIRAFNTRILPHTEDYFYVIEYIVPRYNPDFDRFYNEAAYLLAFVSRGVIGKEYFENGYPDPIDIRPLIEEIALQVSDATNTINRFIQERTKDKN